MAWLILIVSGAFEAVWAVALGKSAGFTRLTPSLIFLVGMIVSMAGLAYAMREIPIGTAYAVWVAIGASLAVAYGMVMGEEPASVLRVLCLAGIVVCVVGLKLAGDSH